MFCKKCGEENPDNAVYCRNCGEKLIEEEVKKAEVIDDSRPYTTTANIPNNNKKNDPSSLECCLCIIGIFIIFAILGLVFHI